jgi:anti-anti-sigma factor
LSEDLRVEIRESSHAWSVVVRGEIDTQSAAQLKEALDRVVADGARLVALDLKQVDFVDSSGLRVILEASAKLRAVEGTLFLEGASPAVLQVLEVTGLIEHLRGADPEQV